MYTIQNIRTGKFLFGTAFGYGPGSCKQRTSFEMMVTYDSLFSAKVDYLHRQCGRDYRIVRLKPPEVDRVIMYDTPGGYDTGVREERSRKVKRRDRQK